MKTETREVFVSEDGKVFDDDKACQDHEREIIAQRKRLDNLQVYLVTSAFDGTEGRGYYRRTYIVTDVSYAAVLQYCFDQFGQPLQPWYGDGHYEEWHIRKCDITAEEAITKAQERHFGVGDYPAKVNLVFLSNAGIDHKDLPEKTPFWPRQIKKPINSK